MEQIFMDIYGAKSGALHSPPSDNVRKKEQMAGVYCTMLYMDDELP